MDRPTKKIKIGEHEVEVKEYITAGEKRRLRDVLLKGAELDFSGGEPKIINFSSNAISEFEDVLIETLVVSVDGSKEKIKERVLEFKAEEFDELMKHLDEISRDVIFTLKKN